MNADIIGSLINAGSGLANFALGQTGTRANMRLQNRLNAQQMLLAHEINKDYQSFVWDNAVPRTVSSQKNAGLNPATMNGTSIGSTGNPLPASGSGLPAPNPHIDFLSGASLGADLDIKEAQRKNIEADTELKLQESDWKRFQNTPEYRDLILQGLENSAIKDLYDAFKSDASIKEIMQNIENLKIKMDLDGEQINYLAAQTGKLAVEADNLRKQGKLLDKDIKFYDVKVAVDRAMASYYHQGSRFYHEQTETQKFKTDSQKVQYLSEKYAYDVLTYLDPDERAKLELGEDIAKIIFEGVRSTGRSKKSVKVTHVKK